MGNLLYLIAVILIIAWAIGFLGYHAGYKLTSLIPALDNTIQCVVCIVRFSKIAGAQKSL